MHLEVPDLGQRRSACCRQDSGVILQCHGGNFKSGGCLPRSSVGEYKHGTHSLRGCDSTALDPIELIQAEVKCEAVGT